MDHFPSSSTFFVLTDRNIPSNIESDTQLSPSSSFSKAIRTFNSTPGSLIFNIYETLRTISGDEMIPHLTNIFLSVDQELCVIQNQITGFSIDLLVFILYSSIISVQDGEFGADKIIESEQHNLQRSVENLHDFYKLIQRPINSLGEVKLSESQLFQSDALDLQSLLLLFNTEQPIPPNELLFLFHSEYDWHNLLVLPDRMTVNNNIQRNSV